MRSATVARDKLIHDADTRADNFVLRLLTHLREILKVDRESTLLEKRKAGRNFDSRCWAQPCAERDIAVHQKVRSFQLFTRSCGCPSPVEGIGRAVIFADA